MVDARYRRQSTSGQTGRRQRERARGGATGRWRHVYGALDLGTNNCRLLVAKPSADGFRVIDAFSRIVRLGEGLAGSGEISAAAMDRTIEALKVCARKMRRRGVTRARNVATEACRKAGNCDDARPPTPQCGPALRTRSTSVPDVRLRLWVLVPSLSSNSSSL